MISIIITNYNKEKFIFKCLNSLKKSVYKNYEIILFDDVSNDNSLKIINKFKKIRILINKKKKFESPALNQINGIRKCLKYARGKVVCFLDSDDFFNKHKLNLIDSYFNNHKNHSCVYNFPFASKKKFIFKNKINTNIWPTIFPTSCISIRKKILRQIFKKLRPNLHPYLEIDARINIFMKFYYDEYNIINKKLTNYGEDNFGITSNIPRYSKKWWVRRYQAYEYLQYVLKLKNKRLSWTFDRLITNLIYQVAKY